MDDVIHEAIREWLFIDEPLPVDHGKYFWITEEDFGRLERKLVAAVRRNR